MSVFFFMYVIIELCNKNQVDTRLIERGMMRKWFLIMLYLLGKTKHFTGCSYVYACVCIKKDTCMFIHSLLSLSLTLMDMSF